jgi:hypothetical protein
MKFSAVNECQQTIFDEDIVVAMKNIHAHLDITSSFMHVILECLKNGLDDKND